MSGLKSFVNRDIPEVDDDDPWRFRLCFRSAATLQRWARKNEHLLVLLSGFQPPTDMRTVIRMYVSVAKILPAAAGLIFGALVVFAVDLTQRVGGALPDFRGLRDALGRPGREGLRGHAHLLADLLSLAVHPGTRDEIIGDFLEMFEDRLALGQPTWKLLVLLLSMTVWSVIDSAQRVVLGSRLGAGK